jgi:8-oxo-dGTP pyrophosphatase MutT (NUDIX family)
MTDTASSDASREGVPAATIIIFRNGPEGGPPEVLMTVRSRNLTFAGGMAVFPGGRVDAADFELGEAFVREGDGALDVEEAAHQIAAVRETLEETRLALGLAGDIDAAKAAEARAMLMSEGALAPVLEAFGWSLDLSAIAPFARWFPKNEDVPRAYDTRFYLADLGTGAVDVSIDHAENTRLFWTTAEGALEAAERDEIKVIFPTRRNLERLALFASFEEAKAHGAAFPIRRITPKVEERGGVPLVTIPEDIGYPITAEPLDRAYRG